MATNKSTSKKTAPAKKSAKKSPPARKSTTGSASDSDSDNASRERGRKSADAPRSASSPRRKSSGAAMARNAAQQLLELTGREAEGVTGFERTEDGWKVHVEVLEVRRIPDTTDILALYEVEMDEDGEMVGYRRLRRYARGVPGEE